VVVFQYAPDIITRYPNVIGGMILARGLTNGPTPDVLRQRYEDEQKAVNTRIGQKPLSEIESLAAWRGVFRGFGIDPTQYRSAAEALLRRLTKQGNIPTINTLVDLANLVSIRYALPIAVLDLREVQGTITVHFAEGSERFKPLGSQEIEHPESGEVIFTDETAMILARRWCWRQSEESAANLNTTDILITIEAHHDQGRTAVESAVRDLTELLTAFTKPNTCDSTILDQSQRQFASS
jgi:DNA/RNA-binding domain of Phe-tRNA-synthetase-like protein